MTAQAEVLDEGRVVAHVVRHQDAPPSGGGAEHVAVWLTRQLRSLRYRNGIDTLSAELLGDGAVDLLLAVGVVTQVGLNLLLAEVEVARGPRDVLALCLPGPDDLDHLKTGVAPASSWTLGTPC